MFLPCQVHTEEERDKDTNWGCVLNDTVYCHFCTWNSPVSSMEETEAKLDNHLLQEHKRKLHWRTDTQTGKVTLIP